MSVYDIHIKAGGAVGLVRPHLFKKFGLWHMKDMPEAVAMETSPSSIRKRRWHKAAQWVQRQDIIARAPMSPDVYPKVTFKDGYWRVSNKGRLACRNPLIGIRWDTAHRWARAANQDLKKESDNG